MTSTKRGARPQILIIGGGFAGLSAAKALRRAPADVTLVDRTNHHLFQPLLYQVGTGVLAPSDVAVPIRWAVRKQQNTTVLMAEVERIDTGRQTVVLDGGARELPYDFLILAAGARHSYFGNDEWEAHAPGLKSLEDAFEIRRRFLLAFEEAEKTDDAAERAALQTIVIVGGGPTGVELAGIIPDTARHAFRRDFRRIDTRDTRVILLEGGDRLLTAYPDGLSEQAKRDLEALRVAVRLNALVTRIDEDAVWVGEERIPTRTVLWAAGNAASPLNQSLGVPLDRAGRAMVRPDLSVPGHPEVFVVGDAAAIGEGDAQVPGVAPAANQAGDAAAQNILRVLQGQAPEPFRYRNKGDLATIGRHKAVASLGRFNFSGRLAWWLWLVVHIMYLVGFRNRISVFVQWAYSYLTWQRGARIITGEMRDQFQDSPAPEAERALQPEW